MEGVRNDPLFLFSFSDIFNANLYLARKETSLMAIQSKTKYYKNLTAGPVRVLEHSIPKAGVIQLPTEDTLGPKFTPSVGVLIGEIDKNEYDAILEKQRENSNILKRRDLPTVTTIVQDNSDPKGYKEITQSVETDPHPRENEILRRQLEQLRNQETITEGIRPEINVDQFPGADFATGSRPDAGDR